MVETLIHIVSSAFVPTVVVSLILGFLTYKNTRAGQRDTREMQDKANTITETQNAMLAYKDLYETEHARRIEVEGDLATARAFVRKDFEQAIRSMNEEEPKGKP